MISSAISFSVSSVIAGLFVLYAFSERAIWRNTRALLVLGKSLIRAEISFWIFEFVATYLPMFAKSLSPVVAYKASLRGLFSEVVVFAKI